MTIDYDKMSDNDLNRAVAEKVMGVDGPFCVCDPPSGRMNFEFCADCENTPQVCT